MSAIQPGILRLYLVLDPDLTRGDPEAVADDALAAGVTCLQLRWKSASDRDVLHLASSLASIAHAHQIPFVVNDRLDIALAAGADGVHLGVDDLPLEHARRIAGRDFIVGFSPDSDEAVRRAASRGATYLGIGPFFATLSKADAGPALGPDGFSRRRRLTSLPVIAIGGINAGNAHKPMRAGASGVAVVSAIAGTVDVVQSTRELARALNREI
jgi:thiamine-phosphate diphosphorylase